MVNIDKIKGSTVFVVDDNSLNLKVLAEYLSGFELVVVPILSGEEALELVLKRKPDIMLLDIMMPAGIDGFETFRRLNMLGQKGSFPVIFMSALSQVKDKVMGFELGAADYITKPFQLEEVLARIKAHLMIRKLQQELNEALVVRGKMQMEELRTNIASSVPHEFRTPLSAIIGFATTIMDFQETMERDEILDCVHAIYRSAERLNKLIQNYLLFARLAVISADPEKIRQLGELRTGNPVSLIERIAEKTALDFSRTNDLVLRSVCDPELLISIEQEDLETMCEELLSNAFKFSQPGTPVEVATATADQLFTIRISDKGRGMTAEHIANIGAYMQFDRKFYEQQGAGLGLCIAKRLAALHGGEFLIESEIDQGTTIVVRLRQAAPDSCGG